MRMQKYKNKIYFASIWEKTYKISEKYLVDKKKKTIFAASNRGIRWKDDNLYGLQRSFRAPALRAIIQQSDGFVCAI